MDGFVLKKCNYIYGFDFAKNGDKSTIVKAHYVKDVLVIDEIIQGEYNVK